ncbi:MAG: hypothetical protein RL738_796, partial [Bacteroidota bacterium]
MQKITTLLAALALTTSCSLQLDSQYGLRWDRRIYAPQSEHTSAITPEVASANAVAAVDVKGATMAPLSAESFTVPTDQLRTYDPLEITESTSIPEAPQTFWAAPESETRPNTNPESPIDAEVPTIKSKLDGTDIIVLKVLATLILGFVGLVLAFYGLIILLITDWTSTTGSWGYILGTVGWPEGLLTTLITGSGVWLCISLIKKLWTKKSKQ